MSENERTVEEWIKHIDTTVYYRDGSGQLEADMAAMFDRVRADEREKFLLERATGS